MPFDILKTCLKLFFRFIAIPLHVVEVFIHLFQLSLEQLHSLLILSQTRLFHQLQYQFKIERNLNQARILCAIRFVSSLINFNLLLNYPFDSL
jgi:hypothetical protein